MCGRYRLTSKERYLRDHFGLDGDPSWAPRWNIAPTQQVPVVRQDMKEPKRTFTPPCWGLIPFWAKDATIGFKTINAMSETAAEKPAFRDAMKLRRCLIPADGFYEWEKLGNKVKQPYNFGMQMTRCLLSLGYGNAGEIQQANRSKRSRFLPPSPTRWLPMCIIVCPRS